MNNFERYYDAIAFLEGLSNLPLNGDYMATQRHQGVYLKRMRYFLNLIGNPDRDMKYIHITGTAGKGTVTNMTHEILRASGKKVGSFTSPFVTTSIEKIRVDDLYIAPDELADIVEYLKPYIDTAYQKGPYGRPSYFEIFLAIAFLYFKQQKCEWVVLEVGLGGRFDATNVIEKVAVTAITTIDYDHTHILGKTLKEIAYDKAGIIKKGSQFFTAEQRPVLVNMFRDICTQVKVPLTHISDKENYQEYNKALVTAIAKSLGITDSDIKKGIARAQLQCRFEIIAERPYIVLDGAHNRSKIRSTIVNLEKLKYQKLFLIVGMAENKDEALILDQIIPCADMVYATRFQIKDRKCAHPKELAQQSKKYLKKSAKIEVFLDPNQAFTKARGAAKENDLILVAGSFFLAGELRKKWFPENWILRKRKSF
jgi:dihydrofolate synthase/folylpolyglutamate synthase